MIALIVLILLNLYLLYTLPSKSAGVSGGTYIVYGTMGCGWTRKQLDHMKAKGIAHEFVDCSTKGACPEGVNAYPTIKHPDGKMTTGFSTL
ncbi:hypothetical protein [Dishui Lake phycodnavirus 2]|nr:hypothetical protein [Dishui Lake phycodnavirus 2]